MSDIEYLKRELDAAEYAVGNCEKKVARAKVDLKGAETALKDAKSWVRDMRAQMASEEQGVPIIPGVAMAGLAEAKGGTN